VEWKCPDSRRVITIAPVAEELDAVEFVVYKQRTAEIVSRDARQ
jgi:hypothetical protein